MEHDTHRRELTSAHVLELWRLGIIEEPTAVARLQNLGWSQIDAEYLLDLNAESERRRVEKSQYEPPYQRASEPPPYAGRPSATPAAAPGHGQPTQPAPGP